MHHIRWAAGDGLHVSVSPGIAVVGWGRLQGIVSETFPFLTGLKLNFRRSILDFKNHPDLDLAVSQLEELLIIQYWRLLWIVVPSYLCNI